MATSKIQKVAVLPAVTTRDPNTLPSDMMNPSSYQDTVPRVSAGDPANKNVKTTGIKMRGAGAATKGFMSRGPMA